jgi:hypothetical protein
MHNKKLSFGLAVLAGCWLSGAALAADPPDAPPPHAPGEAAPGPWLLGAGGPGEPPGAKELFFRDHGPGPGLEHGPGFAGPPQEVVHTLIEIERLYRLQGRNKEVVSLYQDVLGRTKDPLVRHFAYDAIAHAQEQPTDTDKAVATLKQSLDESLQRLNQMPPPPGPGGREHGEHGDKPAAP